MSNNKVDIISRPIGVGKGTVSKLLAESMSNVVLTTEKLREELINQIKDNSGFIINSSLLLS